MQPANWLFLMCLSSELYPVESELPSTEEVEEEMPGLPSDELIWIAKHWFVASFIKPVLELTFFFFY